MFYRALGVYGDIASASATLGYAELEVSGQQWTIKEQIVEQAAVPESIAAAIQNAESGTAASYFALNHAAGQWMATIINHFIETHQLHYRVQLIGLHGFSVVCNENGFPLHQLGDPAEVVAATGINVISHLPMLDHALGGNGGVWPSAASRLSISADSDDLNARALCTAFLAVLRWREEHAYAAVVTGAQRDSCGGAIWSGQIW